MVMASRETEGREGGSTSGSGELWKQVSGALLAVAEDAADLVADEEGVGEGAEWTQRQGVLQLVDQEGAGLDGSVGVGAGFGAEAMAVSPGLEGAAMLNVAEVVVPGEFGDFGVPGQAHGREGEGAEGDGHAGSGAGDDAWESRGIGRTRRGWGEGGFLNAGLLPGGHEARKIFRVGEEGEDELKRKGEPLLGVEGMGHGGRG